MSATDSYTAVNAARKTPRKYLRYYIPLEQDTGKSSKSASGNLVNPDRYKFNYKVGRGRNRNQ